jgi:two-component system LytT family sensor kinase
MPPSWCSQQRGKCAAIYVGAWTVFGTFTAIKVYYAQLLWDKPVPWELAFRRSFKEVFSYALCVLGALWWCRQLRPWLTEGRSRWISGHLVGAAIFALAHLTIVSCLEAGEKSVQTGEPLTFTYLFGQLALHYSFSSFVEYWIVVFAHLGWQYYQAFRERERQAAALATELVQARLQALRMQINPHFLFNTLNTISALVHENPDAADRMIVRLSELLRRTLDRGDVQEVPLREELDFLRGYLEIEQMRFPDRLTVTYDIEPKTNDLLVPHLILQPLVENALRHGIMPREEPGRVKISAAIAAKDTLELKVWNNGNPLPDPNTLAEKSPREGIGLNNVRSRLAQLYGGVQEFTLSNAIGGGVEARLRIPCCTNPRSQAPRVVVMSETEASQAGLPLPTAAAAKAKCCQTEQHA